MQMSDALERERAETTELRNRLQRLDSQYSAFVSGERELVELNERLESELRELRSEMEKARDSAKRDAEQSDQLVASSRTLWTEERSRLQSRIEELDFQLSSATKKLTVATTSYKKVFTPISCLQNLAIKNVRENF